MNKMNTHSGILAVIITLLLFLSSSKSMAQKSINRPTELQQPLIETNRILSTDFKSMEFSNSESNPWDVYAVGKGVISYQNSNRDKPFKELDFMQGLWVTEWDENSGMIRVSKADKWARDGLEGAENMGWVHIDDLLVWNRCLINDHVTELEIKGLIINQAEYFADVSSGDIEDENFGQVYYYQDPELTKRTENFASMLQYFFIYKVHYDENGSARSYLLGKQKQLPALNFRNLEVSAEDIIAGWVPASRTVVWDTRVALESTAIFEESRKMMKERSTPPLIFSTREAALDYYENSRIDKNDLILALDPDSPPLGGSSMRYPQMAFDDPILYVGATGPVTDLTFQNVLMTTEEFERIKQGFELLDYNLRQVNIVFVIDGTTSMQPYFEPVAEVIGSTLKGIKAAHPRNTFRLGAVVYRDYAELVSNRLIEVYELEAFDPENPSAHGLINFLKQIDARDYEDKDPPEAVYYGLRTALTRILPRADEPRTNIVVMIGDAGNHTQNSYTQVDPDMLSGLLAEKGCALLVHQVHHDMNNSVFYNDYTEQLKNIILKTANQIFDKNAHLAEVARQQGFEYGQPVFTEVEQGVYRLDNYPLGATIVTAGEGSTTNPDILKERIIIQLEASQSYLQKQLDIIESFIMGGSQISDEIRNVDESILYNSIGPGIVNQLREMGIDEEMFEIMASERVQIFQKGYAPIQLKTGQYPLFRRTLFVTEGDLVALIDSFRKLSTALNSGDARINMQNAWKEILQTYLVELPGDLSTFNFDAIRRHIWGVGNPSSVLNSFTYAQLNNHTEVTDDIINEYKFETERSLITLGRIKSNVEEQIKYSFLSNNIRYYYIPEDLLP
jgi:hypothetical protein